MCRCVAQRIAFEPGQRWERSHTVIDIHSHILPSVDDGVPSLRLSLDMLHAAAGIRAIVATPHLTARLDPVYNTQIHAAFGQIHQHARALDIALVSGLPPTRPPPHW